MPYVSISPAINIVSSMKRLRLNEKSSILWHKHLGHIFKKRMESLIKNEILLGLEFSDFDTCVDYIKGKLATNVRNAKVDICTELLGGYSYKYLWAIHPPAMGGHKYFIMFICDYFRYGFVELICEKSKYLEAFKAFKAKVEL